MIQFINGPISQEIIAKEVTKHSSKTDIGAHTSFMGQVRTDQIGSKDVSAIHFSAYEAMAKKETSKIKEEIMERYPVKCLHIYHSLEEVRAGAVCFFVFLSAAHRKGCFNALEETVEKIKHRVPIWKQLILEDGTKIWKENEALHNDGQNSIKL